MIRFLARLTLLLLVLAVALTVIRVFMPGSRTDAPLIAVIDPGDCQMPCWQEIRPGVTTMHEAVKLLLANPYIDPASIHPLCEGCVAFIANWKEPRKLISTVPADVTDFSINVENELGKDRVNAILLHINIPLGDFIMRFGPPPSSSLGLVANGSVFYVLEYPEWGMQYDTFALCRQSQNLVTLYGSTLVLQSLDTFISQVGIQINRGWHGFSPRQFDQFVEEQHCQP